MTTTPHPQGATEPRRAARSGQTRDRILAAGVRLIAEHGIDGVNSNVIARAARVGVGTFYTHFADKHVLHREAASLALDGLQSRLGEATRALSDAPPTEQVRALVEAAVGYAEAQPDLFRVAFGHAAPGAARGRPAVVLSPRPTESRLRALQQSGRLDPEIDARVAARAFTSMSTDVIVWWLEARDRPGRDALVETLVRLHPAVACRSTG